MTRKEREDYLFDSICQIRIEAHENNVMLRAIVNYLANEAMHSESENFHDFGRNVLANIVSQSIGFEKLK